VQRYLDVGQDAPGHAQDRRRVPADDLGKGGLVLLGGEPAQQFAVGGLAVRRRNQIAKRWQDTIAGTGRHGRSYPQKELAPCRRCPLERGWRSNPAGKDLYHANPATFVFAREGFFLPLPF
jgi:hypothetical protein